MKISIIQRFKKNLSIAFYQGINLISRSFTGHNSFTSELSYGLSDAGISVSKETALSYTAFWSCVRLLSETLASLPCFLYERVEPRGKNKAINHPLYKLLHGEPNPEMDSFSYFETLMYHLVANNGNCYSYIDWNKNLEIEALWIMNPDKTIKTRDDKGDIVYKYQTEKEGQITIPAYHVWHVPGFGFDGMVGYTPLTYIRNQIGLGVAAEKCGSKLFANGLSIGGVLEHPGQMSTEAQKRFLESIKAEHEGVEKAHRLLILEEGMKYQKNSLSPEDAQFLETRKFQRNEMASFFRIPPHMIGDLDRATFSNIEQQSIEFAVYTMRPWLVRLERAMNRQLLLPQEKSKYYVEFLIDGLLRGDMESRYRAYSIGRNWGWLSANDVCELENRNPIGENGDIYMAPSNMISAEQFNNQVPKPANITNQNNQGG